MTSLGYLASPVSNILTAEVNENIISVQSIVHDGITEVTVIYPGGGH